VYPGIKANISILAESAFFLRDLSLSETLLKLRANPYFAIQFLNDYKGQSIHAKLDNYPIGKYNNQTESVEFFNVVFVGDQGPYAAQISQLRKDAQRVIGTFYLTLDACPKPYFMYKKPLETYPKCYKGMHGLLLSASC
jgi:hypothetical protein